MKPGDTGALLAEIRERRLATETFTARCVWCPDWQVEGTFPETEVARKRHLEVHRVHMRPKRVRSREWTLMTGDLEENIARVRAQGGVGGRGDDTDAV